MSLIFFPGCGFLAPVFGPWYQTSTSNVDQAKDEGYIHFTNVTGDHQIFVDGKSVGSGEAFDGSQTIVQGILAVPPGTHLVEISKGGSLLLKKKVFIGTGSTRSITIQ